MASRKGAKQANASREKYPIVQPLGSKGGFAPLRLARGSLAFGQVAWQRGGMIETISGIAREAGKLLRDGFGSELKVNQAEKHDIKLQMDVDCQRLIESRLRAAFPSHSIIGEEESHGDPLAENRWVVDPLDGTVNYSYGIPHFCVSIALQRRNPSSKLAGPLLGYESVAGVVYDPMRDELFSSERGKGAFLNGRPIRVSERAKMAEAIVAVGLSKSDETIRLGLELLRRLLPKVRKTRAMGSAALDIVYVAAGRFDAYMESSVRLWDIGAGILIAEEAGAFIRLEPIAGSPHTFRTLVSNGKIDFGF